MNEIDALTLKNKISNILKECTDKTIINVCKRSVLDYLLPLGLPCLDSALKKLQSARSLHEVQALIKSVCQILGNAHKIC